MYNVSYIFGWVYKEIRLIKYNESCYGDVVMLSIFMLDLKSLMGVQFIGNSDKALYQIKISGRNNVSRLKENKIEED